MLRPVAFIAILRKFDTDAQRGKRRNIWTVVPKGLAGSPNVRCELPWIAAMQIADRPGYHHDVAWRLVIGENQAPHEVSPVSHEGKRNHAR